jgi:hypothetical protein
MSVEMGGAGGAGGFDERRVIDHPTPLPARTEYLPAGSAPADGQPADALEPLTALVRATPGLARVAAVSGWQIASWTAGAGAAATSYLVRRVLSGEPAANIVTEAATELRTAAWRALGVREQRYDDKGVPEKVQKRKDTGADLRRRGSELMRRANDVHVVEDTHPAFARILSEITPDEARILRYLYLNGPQPALDVRTNRPLGIGSQLIEGGLNMIAEHAGCRYVERIHPYLTNLSRLGLIEFSKEQVSNPSRYQVLEAQPKVAEALRRAGRMPRIVQRSIVLNDFAEEFCRTCLPLGNLQRAVRATDPAPRVDPQP